MARIVYETPIRVMQWDTFSLALKVDDPTGYDWTASDYSEVTIVMISNLVEEGYRNFIFKARSKGETQLLFTNANENGEIYEQREYTVEVPYQIIEHRYGPNLLDNAQMEM